MNMLATIVPKSDQINADDLIGRTLTITVASVEIKAGAEQPVTIFHDAGRPFRPCKSMCRVLVACWGPDATAYVGRSMTLYRDPKVKWGGMEVGGIRISHMTDIKGPHTMALTETKGSRKPFVVQPLRAEPKQAKQEPQRPKPYADWVEQASADLAAAKSREPFLRVKTKADSLLAELRDAQEIALAERLNEAIRDNSARTLTGPTHPEQPPSDDGWPGGDA